MPKLPGREPTFTEHALSPDWLFQYALVYVPGDRRYRCYFCTKVFDTYGDTFGAVVIREEHLHLGKPSHHACGRCVSKLDAMSREARA